MMEMINEANAPPDIDKKTPAREKSSVHFSKLLWTLKWL
jgi:hypothetical protein